MGRNRIMSEDIECPKCHRKGEWKELRNGGIKCKQCLYIMGIQLPRSIPKIPKFDRIEDCPSFQNCEGMKNAIRIDCFSYNSSLCTRCKYWGYRDKVKKNDASMLSL